MAYRRSHYRKGHWRNTKNGPVWVGPTYVSGHEYDPNSSGNIFGNSSCTPPQAPPSSRFSPSTSTDRLTTTFPHTTHNPYRFRIPSDQYEEKYSEAKKLFVTARSSDDYLYVEAFFQGLSNYKNSAFYIDLCKKHYNTYLHYDVEDAIPIDKKNRVLSCNISSNSVSFKNIPVNNETNASVGSNNDIQWFLFFCLLVLLFIFFLHSFR